MALTMNNREIPHHPQDNGNRRTIVPIESSSVCGADLREQLHVRREQESERTREEELEDGQVGKADW